MVHAVDADRSRGGLLSGGSRAQISPGPRINSAVLGPSRPGCGRGVDRSGGGGCGGAGE